MDDNDHSAWLLAVRARCAGVIDAAGDKPNVFKWCGTNPYRDRLSSGYQATGCRFNYSGPADLTAAVVDWWADHKAGDVPRIHLGELIDTMGGFWDSELFHSLTTR